MQLLSAPDGRQFWATANQLAAINVIAAATKGGIARIMGYVATSNRITPETSNYTFTSRFSIIKFYERKQAQLNDLKYKDVAPYVAKNAKLTALDVAVLEAIFKKRRDASVASMQKTIDGNRDDAMRQAHDRCYIRLAPGVKVHLITESVDGIKEPVIIDGHPVCNTVTLDALVIRKEVVVPGEYKTVNSGPDVLMSNAIDAAIRDLYVSNINFCNFTLKEDNFQELRIGGDVVTESDEMVLQEYA